jgi:coproporphyrinogen III oxidase
VRGLAPLRKGAVLNYWNQKTCKLFLHKTRLTMYQSYHSRNGVCSTSLLFHWKQPYFTAVHWKQSYFTAVPLEATILHCCATGSNHTSILCNWKQSYVTALPLEAAILHCCATGSNHTSLLCHWKQPYVTAVPLGAAIRHCCATGSSRKDKILRLKYN